MDKLRQSGSIIRQLKRVQGFHSVTTPVNRGNSGLRASGDLTSQSFVRRPGKVPFGQLRSLIVVVLGKEKSGVDGGGLSRLFCIANYLFFHLSTTSTLSITFP